jgi:hypothetical protein
MLLKSIAFLIKVKDSELINSKNLNYTTSLGKLIPYEDKGHLYLK